MRRSVRYGQGESIAVLLSTQSSNVDGSWRTLHQNTSDVPSITQPPDVVTSPTTLTATHTNGALPPEMTQSAVKEISAPSKRPGKTLAERRQILVDDPRARFPEPHRVMCAICNVWVRMHNTREYDLYNWMRHAEKCEERRAKISQKEVTSGSNAEPDSPRKKGRP